ncbi:Gfo/Idh/MocA family protein [Clostridium senegalense]|uniref:Gfo/Idh/MocA family oxidoreductase n=1 Tax=Clostridium senegalense TaxID=1465809 RepID=A0A6M0H619_9CLOT|nr:Gfo/Idh/MocA family oxidoreductase [Clostridium senegalense]NEU05977.1 Gfo/Idh/MocA family oxidoreductase [Clostridium senegalense]
MKKVKVALIGAGARGMYAYAPYAKENEELLEFVAVAEPNHIRRNQFKEEYKINDENTFLHWKELFKKERLADAIIIANNDESHYEPTKIALEKGYNVLLEKPMSNKLEDIIKLGELARKYKNQIFMICHVLRYTPFFSKLKAIIDSKELGDLVNIQHNENIGYWHFAHSFTRGNWRNSNETSPLILAKSCHDMDILLWFSNSNCRKIASFGELSHMNNLNFKEGMADRCIDCKYKEECPYSAVKLYLGEKPIFKTVVHPVPTKENLKEALKSGPYGRCVYKCDNNVVDHMVTILEFENNITATFNLSAFTQDCNRTLKLMFTNGEVRAHDGKNVIEVKKFTENHWKTIIPEVVESGHLGGDTKIMEDFIALVGGKGGQAKTPAIKSVESHVMAFAAEESRVTGKVVNMNEFWNNKIEGI